jgi:CheY-like chemotaxis protein
MSQPHGTAPTRRERRVESGIERRGSLAVPREREVPRRLGGGTAPALVVARDHDPPRPATADAGDDRPCLLVDDDPLLLRYLAAVFRSRGYGVLTAGTGHEALRILSERRPAFVLLDIGMPDLDGLRLLAALRRHHATSDLPVIMLTSRTGEEALLGALDRGADEYVTKPVAPDELVARVRDVLASRT